MGRRWGAGLCWEQRGRYSPILPAPPRISSSPLLPISTFPIPYNRQFNRKIKKFPGIVTLVASGLDTVLHERNLYEA